MKSVILAAAILPLTSTAFALDGQITIHDPSTVMLCNGKYYTYGTGGTPLVSDDGWTWRAGTRASRTGAAPDVIHIGDRYYQYISGVTMIWSKSLDPESPDYKWEDGGNIVGYESPDDFINPIDPGAFLDPNTGRLWLTYGSYYGFTRVVELDPKTGKRVNPNDTPVNVAVNCEATTMIFQDGWYYLLATHGSCCRGADSGYNIRVGRSQSVTGPYLDHEGIPMIQGGGKLLITSTGRLVGAGHFGLLDLEPGVQKFSMHWEADLDRGGASVLDIRPLLWKDGWPEAGENMKEGTYQIESVRTGTALELAVEGVPVGGGRRGGRGGGFGGAGGGRGTRGAFGGPGETNAPAGPGALAGLGETNAPGGRGGRGARGGGGIFGGTGVPIPPQDVAQVSTNWPAGNIDVRMANYLLQAQQKWTITAVTNAGGYPGSPYFKIAIAGTDRALAATAEGELVSLPSFTSGPEQLWRLDQLTDGTWRIMPKAVPNSKEPLALSAIGSRSATLSKFDPSSPKHRWLIKTP